MIQIVAKKVKDFEHIPIFQWNLKKFLHDESIDLIRRTTTTKY